MTDQQRDPEVEELSASNEEPGTSMHDYLKFRRIARTRFTKLQLVIKRHVKKRRKAEVLQVQGENLENQESRRAEDIRRKREQRELEELLATTRTKNQPSSTRMSNAGAGSSKSYTDVSNPGPL